VGDLPACQREIKALEHRGDEITHEIVRTLNRTFVTPFDHEDIYSLASGLDDILDYIEEVADTANLYGITTIPEPARELAELLARGRSSSSSRRSASSSPAREATSTAPRSTGPLLEVIKLKDLYALLEDALDRCETVANVLEGITTKNA
jgi:uncharacterized protein Yka (UPF0111/DUF47 family)